jgi:hypothetical protein
VLAFVEGASVDLGIGIVGAAQEVLVEDIADIVVEEIEAHQSCRHY